MLRESGELEKKRRLQLRNEFIQADENDVLSRIRNAMLEDEEFQKTLQRVEEKEIDPLSASKQIRDGLKYKFRHNSYK